MINTISIRNVGSSPVLLAATAQEVYVGQTPRSLMESDAIRLEDRAPAQSAWHLSLVC